MKRIMIAAIQKTFADIEEIDFLALATILDP